MFPVFADLVLLPAVIVDLVRVPLAPRKMKKSKLAPPDGGAVLLLWWLGLSGIALVAATGFRVDEVSISVVTKY